MYAFGPNQPNSIKVQETEDYLLGKKRVDSLVEQLANSCGTRYMNITWLQHNEGLPQLEIANSTE